MKATDPAFGCVAFGEKESLYNEGINIRTYLAGKAMQGVLANIEVRGDVDELSKWIVKMADALIIELNKEK